MQAIGKNFDYLSATDWYREWVERGYFNSIPDEREPYTIVIPPPNVTGILHMGHCLNNTIQDVLIRFARIQGKNACWVPGTDHASIATEAKVVQMLREKGIQKASLSREAFLKHAWEWKEKYGGIILQQLRQLGCSLDWNRVTFTMDDHYYQSVISVFNDLYEKGYLYRGKRMIHWDAKAKTALSDEEVIRKEIKQSLYHIRYNVPGVDQGIVIATVRPETIMGDAAICVHPNDERYKIFHGKQATIPLINRSIPIITDDYVTAEFGTGALKVTPAHDMNDYQLGQKHGLDIIDIFNDDGTLNEAAQICVGEDRFIARKKIVEMLQEHGRIVKVEDYTSEVGHSERTDTVVEPKLSLQWWVNTKMIATPALAAVENDEIRFHPVKYKNLYRHWMENIKDWCISRQLWWGHRIPAWYDKAGNVFVARNAAEALSKARRTYPDMTEADLLQDEDCLDTWFSSWLWPFEVFKGYSMPGNNEINYYYPTQALVTAPEIIFFWVARMIMAGYEWMGKKPFSDVYFTGIVRDELGRKMSKQLGNSPDLLALIDKYGADAVRFGILVSSPAGNDLLFDVKNESTLKQGSFFVNKMWNALKLIKMWEQRVLDDGLPQTSFATTWMHHRIYKAKSDMTQMMQHFKFSEALKYLYGLIWDDFCSWYLEWIKPQQEGFIHHLVFQSTIEIFEELLLLLHPFMPFITEEIYQQLSPRNHHLCAKQLASAIEADEAILNEAGLLQQIITTIRELRNRQQLKPKDTINLQIQTQMPDFYKTLGNILMRQVNAYTIGFEPTGGAVATYEQERFYITSDGMREDKEQREKLLKDLEYQQGFLRAVEKKLENENFLKNAKPEVVAAEQKKKIDALTRIANIQASLDEKI
jgi:valyl-tRNA synthetase